LEAEGGKSMNPGATILQERINFCLSMETTIRPRILTFYHTNLVAP
jgi:hypothetical protein